MDFRFHEAMEFFDDEAGFVIGFDREALDFARVFLVIVEFEAVCACIPLGVAPALRADATAHDHGRQAIIGGAQNLRDSAAVPLTSRVVQKRAQALSVEFRWRRELSEISERGVKIDEFDDALANTSIPAASRGSDDERSASAFFEEGAFLPNAEMLAEVVAMVAPQDDDGVVGELQTVERIEHATDLRINEGNAGAVGLQGLAAGEFVEAVVRRGIVVSECGDWDVAAVVGGDFG